MSNFNRVLFMGRLTRAVDLKQTAADPVANIGLAINRKFKTRDGDKREEVVFIDCEAWGRVAETMAKYLNKGDPIFVEGRLKLDTWEQDGQKRSKLKVVIERIEFVGGRSASKPPASSRTALPAVGHGVDEKEIPF